MLSTATELSLETSDAVRLGLGLLNKVECLEAVPASEVSEPGLSDLTMSGGQMVETQHSPPMYPNTEAVAPAPGQPQQPKVQQMTDLSNCTVNTNSNANTNNNNNTNNTNPAPTTMTNPLRIKHFGEHSDRELAELATQEISLDLQGLIDDTHFPDDNLFGDLMDTAKKNEVAMYGIGGQGMRGPGSASTPGSSGQNSPGSDGHNSPTGQPQGYPGHQHPGHYRQNTLGYIPGSVHHGTSYQQHHHHNHPQVKQEPVDQEFTNSCSQAPSSTTNSHYNNNNTGANNSSYSSNTVSSSTGHHAPGQMSPAPVLPFGLGGPLPSLKSFAQQPKYAMAKKGKNPSQGSDEYRRRRERNNVAVRKSREKAKLRTRETEDRVKILARENERLQKKVELLQEELSVLRSLFSSVGVLPDHIHRELAKHLDNFQAQHAAINY